VRDVSSYIRLSEVDLINADGTNERTLVRQTQGGWGWAPSWSPDGRRLAFISTRDRNGPYRGFRQLQGTASVDELENASSKA
jgi:Tol biopolymer transport system component